MHSDTNVTRRSTSGTRRSAGTVFRNARDRFSVTNRSVRKNVNALPQHTHTHLHPCPPVAAGCGSRATRTIPRATSPASVIRRKTNFSRFTFVFLFFVYLFIFICIFFLSFFIASRARWPLRDAVRTRGRNAEYASRRDPRRLLCARPPDATTRRRLASGPLHFDVVTTGRERVAPKIASSFFRSVDALG